MARTGLHANQINNKAAIIDYYQRSGSRVFKTLVCDHGLFDALKGLGVVIIYRRYTDNQRLGGSVEKEFIRGLVDTVSRYPQIDYAEGYNEEFADHDQIGRYAEMEIRRMEALEAIGRKAAIGCFSCGTPALPDDPNHDKRRAWANFRPALMHAHARGHVLALHEYAGPYMQYMIQTPDGKNQWDWNTNSFTGVSMNGAWVTTVEGYLTLRYRKVHRMVLVPFGIGSLPIFITEGGIDDATPRPGPPGKGYKAFVGTGWDNLPGVGDYAEQRYWYMVQVTHDDGLDGRPKIGGVVDFGWEGTATGWPDFDLATDRDMVNRIIAAEGQIPAGGGPAPIPPTPTPTPPPEVIMTHLVDVSHWQGRIDWSRMATQCNGAWIKAAQGTTGTDPEFARNAAGAVAVGLPWAPYHYWLARLNPVEQAEHFHRTARAAGFPLGLAPMVDLEDPDAGLVNPDALKRYVDRVRELFGAAPFIYTGAAWWTPGRFLGGAAPKWAADFPLWIARYGTNDPAAPPATPIVPAPWGKWTIHQYTSRGQGAKYGASSQFIDLNRSPLTIDELRAMAPRPPAPVINWALLSDVAQAEHEQNGIHLSKASALQAAIKAAGQDIVTRERDWTDDSGAYIYEVGQNRATMERTLYVWDGRTGKIESRPL